MIRRVGGRPRAGGRRRRIHGRLPDGSFQPLGASTRAQAAKVLAEVIAHMASWEARGISDLVITTARLRLRPFVPADLDFYAALLADPEVMRYVADGRPRTRQQAEDGLARTIAGYDGAHGMLAVERMADGALVGEAGLLQWDIPGVHDIEVAYTLARPFWGQGIATEAATALRDHALSALGLKRVISLIYPDNRASIRVAEKVGLAYERDATLHGHTVGLYALSRA